MAENKKPGFFYGYVIVVATFFTKAVMFGTFYSFGIFFTPMLSEFGWTRAATSSAFSLCFFLQGLFAVGMGRLTDRFGPRPVMTLCSISFGLGYLLMSQTNAMWQLYLFYGGIIAVGMGGSMIPLLATIARWFVKWRGAITGIVIAGIGVGTIVMPSLSERLISIYGWRASFFIVGIIALVIMTLASQFLKRDPGKIGQVAYGEDRQSAASFNLQTDGFTLGEALHTGQFWMASAMYFCFCYCMTTAIVHIAPHALELGVSSPVAASIVSIIGAVSIVGKVIVGGASDRISNRRSLIISFLLLAVPFLSVSIIRDVPVLYLFAILFGLAYGGVATLESPVVAELFGLGSHGVNFGAVNFFATIGGGLGPAVSGIIFDVTGSYQLAFLICAVLAVIGAVLTLLLRPTPPRGLAQNR